MRIFRKTFMSGLALAAAAAGFGVHETALSNGDKGASGGAAHALLDFPAGMIAPLDLSPDGEMLAYAVRPAGVRREGEVSIWVKPVEGGAAMRLPGAIPMQRAHWSGQEVRVRWSPDGRYVSYFAVEEGEYYLHIWRKDRNKVRVFRDIAACATYFCSGDGVEWSPDSKRVYFLSTHPGAEEAADPDAAQAVDMNARRQLLFHDPEHNGVTVRSYPPADEAAGEPQGEAKSKPVLIDVSVADVEKNKAAVIFSGARTSEINLSPDGKRLIASAQRPRGRKTEQVYHDLYLLNVARALPRSKSRPKPGAVRDGYGERMTPLARNVKMWQPRITWSPQSDRIAYATQGPLAAGDVFVLDVDTGEARNLSKNIETPAPSAPGAWRTPGAGGKFGNPFRSIIWSEDGAFVYAQRGGNIYDEYSSNNASDHDIWKIAAASGEARNLTAGADIAFRYIFNDNGIVTPGREKGRLVAAAAARGGENGLYEIDVASGEITRLAAFPGGSFQGTPASMSRAVRGGKVAFLNERRDAPQEIMAFDLDAARLFNVTAVNASYNVNKAHTRRVIRWRTAEGEESEGLLYLPDTARRNGGGRPAPLIMEVYAGKRYADSQENTYEGRTDHLIEPLGELLNAGYAILTPHTPILGGGESCDGVARHAEAALDAAGALPTVDADRAIVHGASMGGWSVNCILTRTDKFKAGISVAGIANYLSKRFTYQGPGRRIAIGGGPIAAKASVWENPMAFWTDSPISRANDINTPLLLIHGKEDVAVPFEQSVEMYIALSDLEKTVTLVGYDGAGHSTLPQQPDYKTRIIDWVERYIGRP